jgi:hypothetical protein
VLFKTDPYLGVSKFSKIGFLNKYLGEYLNLLSQLKLPIQENVRVSSVKILYLWRIDSQRTLIGFENYIVG